MTDRERDKIIRANIPFVKYLAKPYFRRGLIVDDILQAGYCGLIRAVDRFDPSNGAKLGTFAAFHIRECMDTYIKECGVIKQPSYIARRRKKLFKAVNAFMTKYGKQPTDKELSALTGMTMDKIFELRQLQVMNDQIPDEEELYNVLAQDTQEPVATVEGLFDGLNEREGQIVKLRNGFFDDKVHTLGEISEKLDISRERVRQIEARALDKLRDRKLKRLDR